MSTSDNGAEPAAGRRVDCVDSRSGSSHIVRNHSLGNADTSITLCGSVISREDLQAHINTVSIDDLPDNMCNVCKQSMSSQ